MYKKSIFKTVNIDHVKYDPTFLRIWKYAANPKFFTDAVDKYKHYTNPVVYQSNGIYYMLNHYGSLAAVIALGQDEINLDIIDLHQNDVIEFLLSFQYHEHKERRSLAELIRVTLEYIATPEGRKWIKTITQSDDKEDRVSELFGISKHAARCYLKLIQKGNEKYLKLLAEDKNYRLSSAYASCLADEKKDNSTEDSAPDKGPEKQTGSEKSKGPTKPVPDNSKPDTTIDPDQSAPTTDVETTDQTTSSEPTADQDGSNEDEYRKYLEKYEKGDSTSDEKVPPPPLAQKVLVILSDGKQLELVGKIKLTVDGKIISNTDQLEELPNGNWGIPAGFDDVSLTLVSSDNFWANF